MANLLYVVTNLLDGSTMSSSAEDALFPRANLYDGFPSRPFKFAVAGLNQVIITNLGSAKSVDFCSIHGHNIDSGITAVQFRSSTDNFSSSNDLEATFTVRTPAMYVRLSAPKSRRYWGLQFVGTNSVPVQIGEIVLGLADTLTVEPRHEIETRERRAQIRNRTSAGELSVVNLTDFATKELIMTFRGSYTALEDVRDSLWAATDHGADPCVIVPSDDRPEVHFGHFQGELPISRLFASATAAKELYEYELTFQESAFAVAISVSPLYGAGTVAAAGTASADGVVV